MAGVTRQRPGRRSRRRRSAGRRVTVAGVFKEGYEHGYKQGVTAGRESFNTLFEGTSIIIPTYNKKDYLQLCIESIARHTDLPYEIIVIDNASTDGTAEYLKSVSGQIRYRILETNHGFAGAVNQGLMMAKGQTILLLNNDTLVTPRWLDNMLQCLNSDSRIGMVGPVTNYISGEQRIDVPYESVDDMLPFAEAFNQCDPAKWQRTDRITGFCLLFRRELLERTGYFDEGYVVGNYEDDDYNIRVRLQGFELALARDTFIHHFGSISMKALGDQFMEVNNENERYYLTKWGNPHALVYEAREAASRMGDASAGWPPNGETGFYPSNTFVKGLGDTVYWISEGQRHPVAGEVHAPVVRLSQLELKRWPIGAQVAAAEAEAVWRLVPNEPMTGGSALASAPDGTLYYVESGMRRRVASQHAAEAWGLLDKPQAAFTSDTLMSLPEGLPVIAPIRIVQRL
ncbi:glycosyltransferase family 2 protein [Paenibacillus tarimensis]|uniref:glycosyltransferase family 2 protein n=1 Tax=Paenibacillus tarimensis TaxID=416012 RepID=UPI001F3131F9|nr:glycosyltransferase family 2 protein [Paenibacillus tarimensis]MCF2942984.1 glycosyltransferase family 2 protein [Paenibacillus tarimensis]